MDKKESEGALSDFFALFLFITSKSLPPSRVPAKCDAHLTESIPVLPDLSLQHLGCLGHRRRNTCRVLAAGLGHTRTAAAAAAHQ